MNEKIHKLFIQIMAIFNACLLFLPASLRYCIAEESSNTTKDDLTFYVNNPYILSKFSSSSYTYIRIRYGLANTNSLVSEPRIYAINYAIKNSSGVLSENATWYTLFFYFSETIDSNTNAIRYDSSSDRLNWSNRTSQSISSSYIANVEGARRIYYYNSTSQYAQQNMPDDCPRVILNHGQNEQAILYLFSTDDFSYVPWDFSNSSGGMNFSDGSTLSPENTSRYSQIFIVMDSNDDNSITQEEINYYNYTYNTNYDYSEINEGDNFTELEFLHWIALQIANGNDNPGGGSGSGGGSDAIGGGISIGDGSFTQSQTQTIEENAVNVTVNNDNSLNQENTQWLNSIINNNVGGEEQQNAFENAIGSISGFTGIARSFAGLAGAVLSFLPSWVTVLLGVMFALLFVLIVFRLIHLFI